MPCDATSILTALQTQAAETHDPDVLGRTAVRAIREADLATLRARAPKLLAARDRRAIERWLALVAETA